MRTINPASFLSLLKPSNSKVEYSLELPSPTTPSPTSSLSMSSSESEADTPPVSPARPYSNGTSGGNSKLASLARPPLHRRIALSTVFRSSSGAGDSSDEEDNGAVTPENVQGGGVVGKGGRKGAGFEAEIDRFLASREKHQAGKRHDSFGSVASIGGNGAVPKTTAITSSPKAEQQFIPLRRVRARGATVTIHNDDLPSPSTVFSPSLEQCPTPRPSIMSLDFSNLRPFVPLDVRVPDNTPSGAAAGLGVGAIEGLPELTSISLECFGGLAGAPDEEAGRKEETMMKLERVSTPSEPPSLPPKRPSLSFTSSIRGFSLLEHPVIEDSTLSDIADPSPCALEAIFSPSVFEHDRSPLCYPPPPALCPITPVIHPKVVFSPTSTAYVDPTKTGISYPLDAISPLLLPSPSAFASFVSSAVAAPPTAVVELATVEDRSIAPSPFVKQPSIALSSAILIDQLPLPPLDGHRAPPSSPRPKHREAFSPPIHLSPLPPRSLPSTAASYPRSPFSSSVSSPLSAFPFPSSSSCPTIPNASPRRRSSLFKIVNTDCPTPPRLLQKRSSIHVMVHRELPMLPGGPVGGDVRRRISVGGAPMQGVRRVRTPVSSPRDEAEVVGSGPKPTFAPSELTSRLNNLAIEGPVGAKKDDNPYFWAATVV